MIEHIQIYLAIAAILGSVVITFRRSIRRNRRYAVIDIGVWWLAFLALYSIQPSLFWIFTGEFQSVATNRLEVLNTSASDFADILTISACYAIAFVIAYSNAVGSSRTSSSTPIARIGNNVLFTTAVLFVLLWLVLRIVFADLSAGAGYESKFLNISESSLGVRRLHKFSLTFLVICGIILVVGMMQRPSLRSFAVLSVPILVLISSPGGSRGVAFLVILAFLISWHVLVRRIPRVAWGMLAVFGILAFNLLGAVRSYGYFPGKSELLPWLLSSGEFEHIFGNAVELLHAVRAEGLEVPATTRFAELFAFVPSEFLGFEKTSLPDWFMDNFYPELKATGGGLAFGVMSQAVIGNGGFEALFRGLIFGTLLGGIYKFLIRHSVYWWVFPAYIYLLTRIFDSVRSSMFSFLSDVVQSLVPLIILLSLASWSVRATRSIFSTKPRMPYADASSLPRLTSPNMLDSQ